jgi:hypothetical protein
MSEQPDAQYPYTSSPLEASHGFKELRNEFHTYQRDMEELRTKVDDMSDSVEKIGDSLAQLNHALLGKSKPNEPSKQEDTPDKPQLIPPKIRATTLSSKPASSTPSVTSNCLKPGVPADFDGNRHKGCPFLNSCILYISLCKAEFKNDQAKILWILSYMKEGRAASFADHVLRFELDNPCKPRFADLKAFLEAFVDSFCLANEAMNTILCLKSDRYFQCSRNIDEFKDLIEHSGYTDDLTIIVKFRKGLSPVIQDKITDSKD